MKCKILFFLLIFTALSSYAQDPISYFKKARSMRFSSPDSAEIIALEGLKKVNAQKEVLLAAKFTNLLGNIYTVQGKIEQSDSIYKIAISYAAKANNDTMLSNIYNNLGQIYVDYGSYSTTDSLYQLALKHALKYGDPVYIADTYNNLGTLNMYYRYNAKAVKFFEAGIENYQKLKSTNKNNQIGIADISNNIGEVYYNEGKYDIAAVSFFKALNIFEKNKLWNKAATSCNNIAELFFEKDEYLKALEFCKRSARYSKLDPNQYIIGNSYFTQGKIFFELNQLDSCEYYLKKCISTYSSVNLVYALASPYNSTGSLFEKKKNYPLAKEYFLKSLDINKEAQDTAGMVVNYFNLASIDVKTGNYASAEKLNEEARRVLKPGMYYSLYIDLYGQAADIAAVKKQHEKAYFFIQIHNLYKDSLRSEKNQKQQEELEAIYNNEKKEQALQLANAQNDKQQLQLKSAEEESKRKSTMLIGALVVGFLMVVLIVFVIRSNRQRRKTNELLIEKNSLISRQKEKVEEQKEELFLKNHEIEEKSKEILDSINYAKRIQYALLAHDDLLKQNLKNYFMMFRPKDIVSGDFYWATQKDGLFYLAVCDSTGHGVPGAFMSLLNISFLNEAINEKGIRKPGEIFDHVRKQLIHNLYEARTDESGGRDGMDGILFCFDFKNKIIHYAAANNTPALVRNGEMIYLETDKMPVGLGEKKENFNTYFYEYLAGDIFYLYSDGFADQFGGPKGKKFKYKQLDEMLLKGSNLPMAQQQTIAEETFIKWKQDLEQIDDVCVAGILMQ